MNKVVLIGNLTKDPELKETASGVTVCRFYLAVKRRAAKGEEAETDFFNCVAWRALGETIEKYCVKGNKLAVTGRIEFRSYEDTYGNKRQATDIVVEEVEFLTPKSNAEQSDFPKKKPALQSFDDDGDNPF